MTLERIPLSLSENIRLGEQVRSPQGHRMMGVTIQAHLVTTPFFLIPHSTLGRLSRRRLLLLPSSRVRDALLLLCCQNRCPVLTVRSSASTAEGHPPQTLAASSKPCYQHSLRFYALKPSLTMSVHWHILYQHHSDLLSLIEPKRNVNLFSFEPFIGTCTHASNPTLSLYIF